MRVYTPQPWVPSCQLPVPSSLQVAFPGLWPTPITGIKAATAAAVAAAESANCKCSIQFDYEGGIGKAGRKGSRCEATALDRVPCHGI